MYILKPSKQRTAEDRRAVRNTVADIIDDVCENGDAALRKYCQKFDDNNRENFRVSREEIQEAYEQLTEQELADLKAAHANIRAFARAQRETLTEVHDFSPQEGIYLSDRVIPVNSCLCYVPGGRFPLYSSALMLITPAKEAGVKRIAACSPVMRGTGKMNPKTLAAMDLAGADEIYAVSGAQAVAAFSYGTDHIRPVDMIVGPGNQYVAEAKRQCFGQVGIDFVAGPSEVLVIADKNARPDVLAADLMAQSEHDPNAKGILLTDSEDLGRSVMQCVEEELKILPESNRENASASWRDFGEIRILDSLDQAPDIANEIAPEHHTGKMRQLRLHVHRRKYSRSIRRLRVRHQPHTADYARRPLYRRCLDRHVPESLHTPEHDPRSITGHRAARGQNGPRRRSGRPRDRRR